MRSLLSILRLQEINIDANRCETKPLQNGAKLRFAPHAARTTVPAVITG